jgi:hypothetical protein
MGTMISVKDAVYVFTVRVWTSEGFRISVKDAVYSFRVRV